MYRQDVRPNPLLLVGVGSALVAVFVADAITPLGIIVWIFYLVPVALTLYSWNPSAPIAVATASTLVVGAGILISGPTLPGFPVWLPRLNRALGLTAIWIVALLVRRFITTQIMLRDRDRIRDAQTTLGPLLQGEQSVEQLGARLLTFCCERIGAAVATLYVSRGQSNYEWCTSYAGEQLHGLRPSLVAGDGLCGQAIRDRRILCFADIPEGYLPIASSLGSATPRQLVAVPFVVDDQVVGVAEFGLLHSLRPLERELLSTVAESVAMAIRSAQYRTELAALLEETRQQAEELRTQQEELQATNELLASHGRALEASQARLEQQQAQLESTNVELEVQTASLEQQRDQLSLTHAELVEKAEALERASHFKSEFLANMSHELRTPLNSALILAKLLESNRDGHLSPEEVGYAATIYSAGSDLLVLINDILDLSRIEAGRLELHAEDVVLASMLGSLNTTFEPVAAQKGLTFEVRTAPNLPATLRTDDLRLQQILRNLLANAFKFTRHGSVVLSVSLAAPELLRFSVTDTGIGIPAAAMDVIFDAFRQADGSTSRNYGGTGLGLTISRELARRLGGTLSVESEVGRGSAFTLLLPLVVDHAIAAQIGENPTMRDSVSLGKTSMPAEAVGSPSVPDDRERLSPTGRTILVVEDDARFAAILRDLARERHFQAIVATNASDGLDLAERYRPSAILLDVHLPDHSGLALLEQLKRHPRTRPIPVHVVSVSDHAQQALELGAIGYALKPIQREQLGMALTRLEHKLDQCLRRVLIVEDSEPQRASIDALLKRDGVEMVSVGTGREALAELSRETFDCMVLDLTLPDMSGYDVLDQMARGDAFSFPPVIVYTGHELSREQLQRLDRYSSSVIIKGARSPERLLDEVSLFLHQVEEQLPEEQQLMLRSVRHRESQFEGRSILVVEDDARNIFALSSILEPKGSRLHIARNGREALELLGRSLDDSALSVDLVLMDVMMPVMDGLAATREIRRNPRWSKLPIIALTAKAMPGDRQKCIEAGASDYIAKPLDVDRLISLIKVWLPKQVLA